MQDLQRDALADLDVLGEVDLAHPALAQQLDHAIAAIDLGADEIGLGLLVELRLGERGRGLRTLELRRRRAGDRRQIAPVVGLAAIVAVTPAVERAAAHGAGLAHRWLGAR